jgi:mycothiol synthase
VSLEVVPFEPESATEEDLHGYHEVMLGRQQDDRLDEPPLTYDDVLGRLRNPFVGLGPVVHWVARLHGKVVGVAFVYFLEAESSHIGLTEIIVHPGARRQGIGTEMMRVLIPELRARGRSLLENWQVTKDGDGARWAASLGFRNVHSVLMQALVFPDADRARWQDSPPAGYHLRRWIGSAPDDLVTSFATARTAMRDAPVGDLGFQEPEWTAERVRARETELREKNVELRAVVAVHEATGEVAGLTEIELHPHRRYWVYQRDTAVSPEHRGRGLGLSLKAHMIHWLLAGRPDLDRVYTTTGAGNDHMIRVNHRLGFTTVRTMVAVSHDLAALEAELVK